jgi:hypothetical protein
MANQHITFAQIATRLARSLICNSISEASITISLNVRDAVTSWELTKEIRLVALMIMKMIGSRLENNEKHAIAGCFMILAFAFKRALFLLCYPMLRRGFRYHVNGALKSLPCVRLKFNFLLISRLFRHGTPTVVQSTSEGQSAPRS